MDRLKIGKSCSLLGVFLNLFLFAIKLFTGIISGSLASTADALNNLSDSMASFVSLFGFHVSGKRADADHPYGHARAEHLSALIVSLIVVFIAFELIKTAVGDIISPPVVSLSPSVFIILIISVAIKIFMAVFNYRTGKKIDSDTLIASAADSRNDALITCGIILSYIISYKFNVNSDGFISLIISIFILISGISLIKNAINPLLGQAAPKETVEYIHKKILSYPKVLGAHDLTLHAYGAQKIFAGVHVEMSCDLSPTESHDIIDKIEKDFLNDNNINMIIHLDPISDTLSSLYCTINSIASKIHHECTIHDISLKDDVISFDCVKPEGCPLTDDALKTAFEVALSFILPGKTAQITVDSGFSPIID